MDGIITSKYDTDGYKISMGNIFWWLNMIQGKNIQGRYQFVDRDNRMFTQRFADELKEEIVSWESLPSDSGVSNYIAQKWPFVNQEFLRWYDQVFYHDSSQVDLSYKDGKIRLIAEGPIHTATHIEIPALRAISTLVTKHSGLEPKDGWQTEAWNRAQTLQQKNVVYSEFGGRRPWNPQVHRESLAQYAKFRKIDSAGGLLGTSWIKYAYDFNLMIMGTMAHEYIQMMAALFGYEQANLMAMQMWIDYYGKRLGYYLPDTFTTDVALRSFTYKYANIFGGTRQDSGDPKAYADKLVNHYLSLGIDPRTKSIIYSNSLRTIPEILDLNEYRLGKFIRSFGLGGFITNNVGYKAHNMVLKLVAIRIGNGEWIDTVKLSDDYGKHVGKPEEAENCKRILKIQ